MPAGVDVDVSDVAVISALNTPGGAVFKWRDDTVSNILRVAIGTSPVNNPANAVHRGGAPTGGIAYKAAWASDRVGSNGHTVRGTVFNGSDHADIVEFGRGPSFKFQRFSWTRWGGEIGSVGRTGEAVGTHGRGTGPRAGRHILRNAVNFVMPSATGGTYTPL